MVLLRAMGAAAGEAIATSRSKAEPRTVRLPVQKLTADSFRPFGQVRLKKMYLWACRSRTPQIAQD